MSELLKRDPWLAPYAKALTSREATLQRKVARLLDGATPATFALGFHHFGLHQTTKGWEFREWAPNATRVVLVGEFSEWQERQEYALHPGAHGEWELQLSPKALRHGQHYKLRVHWCGGGSGWRLPSYATYVVQETDGVGFAAIVWAPDEPYAWRHDTPPAPDTPLIYEAHVGMSSEAPEVASFDYFCSEVLPRIKQAGYNTVQLMAIAEHPYYGSFGYHVSNFFAVSSRFGTPDDFKRLVDTAHGLGLRVIIDLVHSHTVKNEAEGLSRFDGTLTQYCRGDHPAWDSRLFDYGRPEVAHFLASNCRWWLDEYHIDGFRFDGVTSMIYQHHGLGKSFTSYDDYFGDDVDVDALAYLRLANHVIHAVRSDAVTIAEEMSGLPGLCLPVDQGGIGFDYRLNMGAPDLWIKTLKERRDEDWDLGELVHTLNSHRPEERVISYAESHDQALVGDKTLIFRLIDAAMYQHMDKADPDSGVERGVALHKLIRLLTAGLHSGGYLNFMGNEFGHPEWIDFPREGNAWSYHHARRQWSLVDNGFLKYQWLGEFDRALMQLLPDLDSHNLRHVQTNNHDGTATFQRGDLLFACNISPDNSYTDLSIAADPGSYRIVLDSDDYRFGGHGRAQSNSRFLTQSHDQHHRLQLYLPTRSGIILKKID